MPPIGTELQEVLDLVPQYTRAASPSMHARDEACRRLQGELRKALSAMPATLASGLDVAVGGQQGSYSPLAWVRIYSAEHSPSATAGVYLAYLFAADGSRVYLSLQQGSSEVRSGHMRPVSDPTELLARGAGARSAIRELIDGPLGAGMTIKIDLRWGQLSSVGSYSKQRIRNYEYANILAIDYDSGAIPAASTLVADLHRSVVLLSALYGDTTLAEAAIVPPPGSTMPDTANLAAARAQGVLTEAAIRRAVELHAEDSAETYFQGLGWSVQRVGPQKLGYDLDCKNAAGASLHVEVKGTQGLGEEVFLTRNEASHSGPQSECGAEHALYVLSGIEVHEAGVIKCTGGITHCVRPWIVDQAALTPTVYAYRVPEQ
jgi:MrcB-like, N-terminal domain/Protein NO VEIN, C-terminal